MEEKNLSAERNDIVEDFSSVTDTSVELDGKRFPLRNRINGCAEEKFLNVWAYGYQRPCCEKRRKKMFGRGDSVADIREEM